jgi:hypothetical protein
MATTKSKSASKTESASTARPTPKRAARAKPAEGSGMQVTPEQRYHMIAEAAYFYAERRGFAAGDPGLDWLEAEAEIDRLLQSPWRAGMESQATAKEAFQQRLEAQLKEWDDRLGELKAKAMDDGSELRADYEKQLETLTAKRDALQTKATELRKRTEDAWEDLKSGTEKAWDDMRDTLNRITSRFK